eukprot:CAMPEP_0198241716 /NCGR_PEP_ID=MMETSP1446-20131203/6460_1 /TAXON_ID=1461542 ORGANISM="Unidentified sp, Strain CCMP2111" /NCGR_SAMPLE_ID=MMETSP1446 /ASSEMBLY_ACC=CAM_ASM_001112 /LENGTH=232 /DNA_ID=CAMNT_0043924593 /DNA_START=171 /DNA_END=869 /DNA_ORIENTATION=-
MATPTPSALLDVKVLKNIFLFLDFDQLASLKLVCSFWKRVLSDTALWNERLALEWGLRKVTGSPNQLTIYKNVRRLGFFYRRPIQPGDSLASIALASGSSVSAIKQSNNLISETPASIASRKVLYIPCGNLNLNRASAQFEYCSITRRDYCVIDHSDGGGGEATPDQSHCRSPLVSAPTGRDKRLLEDVMAKSLKIDDCTARFYLECNDFDLKDAMKNYQDDLRWEEKTKRD